MNPRLSHPRNDKGGNFVSTAFLCGGALALQPNDIVCGIRSTYGGGASASEVWFKELTGGEGYSGGQEESCLVHVRDDMSAFGMKSEGWRKVVQKVGRWCRRAKQGADLFMHK